MKSIYYLFIGLILSLLSACASTENTKLTNAHSGTALVAGATGRTGRIIVNKLLEQGYKVRVFVRNPKKANSLFQDSVEIAVGDVRDKSSIATAMKDVRWVFSAIGAGRSKDPTNIPEFVDYGGTKNLVDAAVINKVEQFIMVSSRSAGKKDHRLNRMHNNVLIWKLKGENALRDSGIPYTIVRPGGLRDEKGGLNKILAFAPEQLNTTLRMIPREDVAATCVAALNNPDAIGKTLAIVSDPSAKPIEWKQLFKAIPLD